MGYTPDKIKDLENQVDQITAPNAAPSGYTPEKIADLESQAAAITGAQTSSPGVFSQIAQGLNVIPGTTRTLVRGGLDEIGGDFNGQNFRDALDKAIHGRAAPSSQMFAPEIKALTGSNDSLPAKALGLGSDVLLDPTGSILGGAMKVAGKGAEYLSNLGRMGIDEAQALPTSLGSSAMDWVRDKLASLGALSDPSVAQGAQTPISSTVRAVGRKIFKNGYSDLDRAVTSASVPAPSDVLLEMGIPSTERGVKAKLASTVDKLANTTNDIITKVSSNPALQGGVIEPINMDAAMDAARGTIKDLSRAAVDHPGIQQATPFIEHEAGKLDLTPADAAYIAQRFRLGARAAYGEGGQGAAAKAQIFRDASRGIMDNIGEYISDIDSKTGKLYNDANHKLGSLIEAEGSVRSGEAPLLDNLDTAGLAAAEVLKNPVAAKMVLLKKALEAALGRGGQTYGGLALERLGKLGQAIPGLETTGRQLYIHGQSPWLNLPSTGGPDATQGK